MHEGSDDPRLSADGELALARLALDANDLRHAADHLAGAISFAPTMPEVHETLAQLAARSDGGLDLFPLEEHPFIGTVVARAHLLAAAGKPGEGLALLATATQHAPGMDWANVPWVSTPDLPARLDAGQVARVLLQVCSGIPDPVPEEERPPLLPYLTLARHAVRAHPRHGLLLGAASVLARCLGEIKASVDWARQGVRAQPSKLGEVCLGYAYRSAGRTKDALAALRRAIGYDPDDLSVYADIANTLADDGRLDEALDWIDRALTRDPSFDCAVHTAHRLRYQRDGGIEHLVALADFQREHPNDSHEHTDLAECCHGQPWLGTVPLANEAVINVMRQVLEEFEGVEETPSGGQLRVEELEVPSAMRTVMTAIPGQVVTVGRVSEPDIREPRRPVTLQLWRYHGTDVEPVVPPPSDTAVERIRQLAHPVWPHPPAAYDAAVGLATLDLDDLLGLLTHPPSPPDTELGRALAAHEPALWVRCVQVWASLGILHHRTDEPWPVSTRRQVLLDLVWGVEDWITEAALFALVTMAWVDPTVRDDVAKVVSERLVDAASVALRHRPVSIVESLAGLALATPAVEPSVIELAHKLVKVDAEAHSPGRRAPGRVRRWLTRRR